MLWPFMPNRAQRTQLFAMLANEKPDFLVHRWREYKFDVPSLRPEEIEKIERAAGTIITSFATAIPVRAVLVQRHADYDLRRFGTDRENFEREISKARAREVGKRLKNSLDDKCPLPTPEEESLLNLMFWKTEGFGSQRRITTRPTNEYEMSLNRRAEIFFARAARPIRFAIEMHCQHGGLVTRGFTQGLPSATDRWIVKGCGFTIQIGNQFVPSPCHNVRWLFLIATA